MAERGRQSEPHSALHGEPLRVTLTRTVGIAVVAGGIIALSTRNLRHWPAFSLLLFWPAFGGHWIDLLFLNALQPRLPPSGLIRIVSRIALWFVGGIVLAAGMRLTARALFEHQPLGWLTWPVAGALFVATELAAHGVMQLRGRPSFYSGLG